jgi:peptide-methionine (R)-S-oxide reductase
MDRRHFLSAALVGLAAACTRSPRGDGAAGSFPLEKSRSEWRELLSPEAYAVLFEEQTEPAFSSPLDGETRDGTYLCAACFQPLFDSSTKYDSGTGWPSFWAPIEGRVGTRRDFKLIIPRTEYHCARCGGHQGHVFNDGPPPTGQRWCNNGVALRYAPAGEPLPKLRS